MKLFKSETGNCFAFFILLYVIFDVGTYNTKWTLVLAIKLNGIMPIYVEMSRR